MSIDLSLLPPPSIIDSLDFETLFAERKARLLELTPEGDRPTLSEALALESEPLVKLLQENAYRELLLRQLLNERAQALLVAYATGAELDHIGVSYYATARLQINPGDPDAIPPVAPLYESDTDYRRRLLLAPDGWSTAGPRDGYIYHALSADGDVKDASAITLAPGQVTITVLSNTGNGIADAGLQATVLAALNDDTVRPLTDSVSVQSATVIEYNIAATITVAPGPDASVVRDAAEAKIQAFVDAHHKLGAGVVRDAALAVLYVEGVSRVELNLEQDITCDNTQAAYCTAVTVTLA
ncbi:MAG: baseplate J/gp47 family protein [Porticoccaceae bacterium]|jgi:phage-related baseplate assembly protein